MTAGRRLSCRGSSASPARTGWSGSDGGAAAVVPGVVGVALPVGRWVGSGVVPGGFVRRWGGSPPAGAGGRSGT
ncbi:hypothetical protein APASM_0795 [Actinosynnema pretiosum subsp. pretiosum]|nr:hypothetical protein APASM_0795 [Actinosynnema pretiosum subsp. pretiosum]